MFSVRKWQKGSFISIALMFLASSTAHAELIVNINARNNHYSNPVVLHLNAGTYDVVPIGVADGGLWDAWSTFNSQAGSWKSGYAISSAETGEMYIPSQASGPYYATPQLALEAAPSTSFELTQAADVRFFIWDGSDGSNTAYDNGGGMSLSIIPEPASLGLLGISDFSINAAGEVMVAATNTTSITRYALQSSTNLSDWADAQFRLARSSSQTFEMPLPTDEDSMFFRIEENPFSTALLPTGMTTKLFSLTTYNPVSPAAHWMTCNQTFITTGIGVLSSIQSSGFVVYPPTITNSYTIAADGSVSDVMGVIDVGLVNLNSDLQVSVDGGVGWAQMLIGLQSGGNDYTTSDLEGFWEMYTLTVADNVGDYVGWGVSEYLFDAAGIGTTLSTERSDGSTDLSPSVTFAVNSDGSISGGPPGSTWFMSQDKNLIVTVMGHGGDGVTLGIMVRDEGSGCKTADIAGHWRLIQLVTADDPGDWVGWQSAALDISTNGYINGATMQRSDGTSFPLPPFSLWVADEGTVNGGGWVDSLLTLDKDLIVGIGNDIGGGLSIGLMLRN